jgi:hypothetical protein
MGGGFALPWSQRFEHWNEKWQSAQERLSKIESALEKRGCAFARGGEYDRWDLEVRGGLLGGARLIAVAEEHQGGAQMVRFRLWPSYWFGLIGWMCALFIIAAALTHRTTYESVIFAAVAGLIVIRAVYECSAAMGAIVKCLPGKIKPNDVAEIIPEDVETRRSSPGRSVVETRGSPLGEDLEITPVST